MQQETRPDTRQYSRGPLGRSHNAKTARNLTIFWTYRRTDLPTDTASSRVACPRLKIESTPTAHERGITHYFHQLSDFSNICFLLPEKQKKQTETKFSIAIPEVK